MATNRWLGNALAVAQVNTITVASTPANGQVYSVTINGKTLSYTATGTDTNNTIAAALQAVLAASTAPPEFQEVLWTVSNNVITGTALTPGMPFTNTSAATGTGTCVTAVTTASSGPNDISVGANWSTGAIPNTGDDIHFQGSNVPDALYSLSALNSVTPNSVTVWADFTGNIGLLAWNGSYQEYRPQYLQLNGVTTVLQIGTGQGTGSGRLKFDTLSGQTTLLVFNTTSPNEQNGQSVRWKGTNANNVVEVVKGNVGIAAAPGEVATVATLDVTYQTNLSGDATVICGAGTTLTTINQAGGTLTIQSAATTVNQTAGTLTVMGNAVNITTLTVDAGTCYYNSTGTIATLNVGNNGTASFNQDLRSKTVTNTNLYAGATLLDTQGKVTWGSPIQLARCRIGDVTLDLGENRKLAPS